LPNHFHFLLRIRSIQAIVENLKLKNINDHTVTEKEFLAGKINLSEIAEIAFKNMFQSYSLAFNKQHHRKGNLLYKPFKRVKVDKESQFTQTIIYIHANPLKHRITNDFTAYKWSSYKSIVSQTPTKLLRKEMIDWFGNPALFEKAHMQLTEYYYNSNEIGIEE